MVWLRRVITHTHTQTYTHTVTYTHTCYCEIVWLRRDVTCYTLVTTMLQRWNNAPLFQRWQSMLKLQCWRTVVSMLTINRWSFNVEGPYWKYLNGSKLIEAYRGPIYIHINTYIYIYIYITHTHTHTYTHTQTYTDSHTHTFYCNSCEQLAPQHYTLKIPHFGFWPLLTFNE